MIYDLVIKNVDYVSPLEDKIIRKKNIGIKGEIIITICDIENILEGNKTLDAKGKIVAPGFIDFHSHVDGNRTLAELVLRQGATTTIGGERNFNGKKNRKIVDSGFIINQGYYVSHSFTLRQAVGLNDPYRIATPSEIEAMNTLAEQFIKNGAFGIHFGLEFVPGTSNEEMLSMAKLAKKYNQIMVVHLRKDGTQALESIDEIIKISKDTGASIHILHLMYMVGFRGMMSRALEMIDEARKDGLDITADTGIYDAFPSYIGSSILDEGWEEHYGKNVNKNTLVISSGIYAGHYCDEELFKFLREEFPNTLITVFVCDEKEAEHALKKNYVFVSTNAADGPHYENMGHPETSGTFPKLIDMYVKKKGLLSLPKAIKKITYDPAQRFKIQNKGEIKEGFDADLVIFDLDKIKDNSKYVGQGDPNEPPSGISKVIVNGKVVLENGELTKNINAGKMITSTKRV